MLYVLSGDYQTDSYILINPLISHNALKHHFTSLKTHLIILQLGLLE